LLCFLSSFVTQPNQSSDLKGPVGIRVDTYLENTVYRKISFHCQDLESIIPPCMQPFKNKGDVEATIINLIQHIGQSCPISMQVVGYTENTRHENNFRTLLLTTLILI